MEKILNKRKFREIMKYLVQWKWFTVKHDSWKREKDLENAKKVVAEFKERLNADFKRQEKLNMIKERNYHK